MKTSTRKGFGSSGKVIMNRITFLLSLGIFVTNWTTRQARGIKKLQELTT